MKRFVILSVILVVVVFCSTVSRGCQISFGELQASNVVRHVYERDIFNITGQLEFCPTSFVVQNLSISNPRLKSLSILNVSYYFENNRMNITALARLIGFTPLSIQLFFLGQGNSRFVEHSLENASEEQKSCAMSSSDRLDILENCPSIKYEDGFYVLSQSITVAIKRHQTVIDALFTGVVFFLVTMGTLCIGCGLEMEQIVDNLRKPIPLLLGLFCQIVYVPLLSYAITKIFRFDHAASLGLISTASSPGGGSSNIFTALLAGDVDLSVTMTFLSTIFSFGTFPFWLWLLGRGHVDFSKIQFPWWSMLLSVFTLFLPALTGFLLRRYRPVVAHRIGRYLNPIAVGYLVFLLTFGVYINMFIFHIIDYKAIMACCFLPWFGFIGGAILSLIGVKDRKKTIAICIETGIQNTAVSIFFLRLTFPQPEADIALSNPILVSMATPIPFLVLIISKSVMKRFACCRRFLPKREKKAAVEKNDTPEKALMKELVDENAQDSSAGQIGKSPV